MGTEHVSHQHIWGEAVKKAEKWQCGEHVWREVLKNMWRYKTWSNKVGMVDDSGARQCK
jgi:hypothetical protein